MTYHTLLSPSNRKSNRVKAHGLHLHYSLLRLSNNSDSVLNKQYGRMKLINNSKKSVNYECINFDR